MISYKDEFDGLSKYIPDEEERNMLLRFRRGISPYGFELYTAKYFEHVEGYKTNITEKYDMDCVDVEGFKENEELLVQCKKWQTYTSRNPITIKEVREFFGAIQKRKNNKTRLLYITTTWTSPNARKFCSESNIELWDYRKIIEILKIYPFNAFLNYILYNKESYSYKEVFEKNVIEFIGNERDNKIQNILQETRYETEEFKKDVRQEEKQGPLKLKLKFQFLEISYKKCFAFVLIILALSFFYSYKSSKLMMPQIQTSVIEGSKQGAQSIKRRNIQKTVHPIMPNIDVAKN